MNYMRKFFVTLQVMDNSFLDSFERTLEEGLRKLCAGAGFLKEGYLDFQDVSEKWNEYIKDYVADAVENFNEYPEVALAWAAFLGMGVAHNWDEDWEIHSKDAYSDYYGPRGFDDMDENVLYNILKLDRETAGKLSETMDSCAVAALGLLRHQGIESQTAEGFFALSRSYSVMFRIGAEIELRRLGYKMVRIR